VRLFGHERDVEGAQVGTLWVSPTGAPLYLLSDLAVADTARSDDGRYVFCDVQPGSYAVSCEVAPGVADTTSSFDVGEADVSVADTLALGSTGARLTTRPNPLSGQVTIAFLVESADSILLELRDVSLSWVKDLESGHKDPGVHEVLWDGTNADGLPVQPGAYWAILRQPESVDADLVFVAD
jgi:hypothetical protein